MAQNHFCCNYTKEQTHPVMASSEQNYQMQTANMETIAEARFEGKWQYV